MVVLGTKTPLFEVIFVIDSVVPPGLEMVMVNTEAVFAATLPKEDQTIGGSPGRPHYTTSAAKTSQVTKTTKSKFEDVVDFVLLFLDFVLLLNI